MGKMNVVKMCIPPKLLYRFNTAPVNGQNGLDQLDKVILEFIRKNKALSTDIFFKKGGSEGGLPHPNMKLTGH